MIIHFSHTWHDCTCGRLDEWQLLIRDTIGIVSLHYFTFLSVTPFSLLGGGGYSISICIHIIPYFLLEVVSEFDPVNFRQWNVFTISISNL